MIDQMLVEAVISGFPSFAGLVLLAWVLLNIVRANEKRERERELWFMSVLEKVLSLSDNGKPADNATGHEETD